MSVDLHGLELLWRRLEHAKLQLDQCHNIVKEIAHDTILGVVSRPDGNYTYARERKAEEAAIKNYLDALRAFKEELRKGSPEAASDAGDADGFGITPREREVLALIAFGKSSRQIAEILGISFKTVTTHRYRLQKKLNAHHTADLTRIAIRMGLAQP